ncbi:CDP-alcohol phosphatidyltransferase [Flavobacteriaceae bacterium CRH]|nr:CDP-alcohol phosphatidyltransferase [Flavobacteriaceae bacterium CRH]
MNKFSFKYFTKSLIVITTLLNIISGNLLAQSKNPSPLHFPTPKNIENMLFYIQRDPNTNTAIYAINYQENGKINKSNPVKAYWIRYAEKGEKKDFSYIQRKFAYGIESKTLNNEEFELQFVSYKKLSLILKKIDSDQKYHVFVNVNQKIIQVEKIFVRIEGGSFWLPNVKYVEVTGIDVSSNKIITERMLLK